MDASVVEDDLVVYIVTVQEAYDSMTTFQKKAVDVLCRASYEKGIQKGKQSRAKR